jgi:hypothetical protein
LQVGWETEQGEVLEHGGEVKLRPKCARDIGGGDETRVDAGETVACIQPMKLVLYLLAGVPV